MVTIPNILRCGLETSSPSQRLGYETLGKSDEEDESSIELSLLASPHPSSSLQATEMGKSSDNDSKKEGQISFHFPEDPNPSSWRPPLLRPFPIAWAAATYFVLGGLQECMYRSSVGAKSAETVSPQVYLVSRLILAFVMVVASVFWQVADIHVKRLEPYHQLRQRNGAPAASSLDLDYTTRLGASVPFTALRQRHWHVLVSSLASTLSAYVAIVLQAVTVSATSADEHEVGNVRITVQPVLSRLLTMCLFAVGACGVSLVLLTREPSGLVGDPKGIAGVAAMATRSNILNDFKDLDTASNYRPGSKFGSRHYKLYRGTLWQGILPDTERRMRARTYEGNRLLPLIMLRRSTGWMLILYLLFATTFMTVFLLHVQRPPSTRFGMAFVPGSLTLVAASIKACWSGFDIHLRIMEPYSILSERRASPDVLTLDYTGMAPLWVTFQALKKKRRSVALASFGSVLASVLLICTTLLDTTSQILISKNARISSPCPRELLPFLQASLWALISGICILLYLNGTASWIYWSRRSTILPRQPGSIASVLTYVSPSKLLYDLVDAQSMDSKCLTKHLEGLGRTYGFGWYSGRDGVVHCGIDEEPIIADYEHGLAFSTSISRSFESIAPWDQF